MAIVLTTSAMLLAGCSETTSAGSGSGTTSTVTSTSCGAGTSVVACTPSGSMLSPYMTKTATKATGSPIVIGTINQDSGAAGAFPELTEADKVAVDFVNSELNGIDGHPLELLTCNTNGDPELSQSCAQEMVTKHVMAVVGGIDIWGTGIQTLTNNGIPYVGGVPVSTESVQSKVSFQFSGGTWGAALGLGEYAIRTLHARKIAMIYIDFGPIANSAKLAASVFERHGAQVTLVSVSAINPDLVTAMNQAAQSSPDAIIALTADTGCKPAMLTAKQIGIKVPLMYTGACAATDILSSLGSAANNSIFNVEADLNRSSPDNVLYHDIVDHYGPKYGYQWQSAGTVSFRSLINLYVVMRRLGVDKITPTAIAGMFRSAKDQPSFFGHPYTCNGHQLNGYPAMCSPQQSLAVYKNGSIKQLTGWIDVGSFAR